MGGIDRTQQAAQSQQQQSKDQKKQGAQKEGIITFKGKPSF
jgi:hypothetical protein